MPVLWIDLKNLHDVTCGKRKLKQSFWIHDILFVKFLRIIKYQFNLNAIHKSIILYHSSRQGKHNLEFLEILLNSISTENITGKDNPYPLKVMEEQNTEKGRMMHDLWYLRF